MFQRTVSHGGQPLSLLVETDEPCELISDFTSFVEAGFEVAVCAGPDAAHACPAVDGHGCTLVEHADVVFNEFRDPELRRSTSFAVKAVVPDTAMVVSVPSGSEIDLPEGCVPLSTAVSVSGQVEQLRRSALDARARRRSRAPQ
jgi:hypothetical protein